MKYILSGAHVFLKDKFISSDILINDGRIVDISPNIIADVDAHVFKLNRCFVFPGLIDVHVHLREPGFFYKETIRSGSTAAASAGYTTVCTMPNLNPVPDCRENLKKQLDIIKRDSLVKIYPYAAITVGEKGEILSEMEDIAGDTVAFSDDGKGIQSAEMMREAMLRAKALGKIIAAHCEDEKLLHGGYIHDGEYAKKHNHKGICSESEWGQIKRDIELAAQTGCSYHICHVSTKESVEIIRQAKSDGIDVTCETAPHYLTLCDDDLQEDGRFKMNPPLRGAADRQALIDGLLDGTIDMIATDHAPHSYEEKSRGLRDSAMGVVGLECAVPMLYTKLVKTGIITLPKLIELMHTKPQNRFKIGSSLESGNAADLCVYNFESEYTIDPDKFNTMGRATPFEGERVFGECVLTMVDGKVVWEKEKRLD